MKPVAGLWIDHREAVIVLLSDKGQETRRVKSHVEKQLRRSGRSPSQAPFEEQMVPADDSREREYSGHLANYYDQVISCLRPAKAILLFGPGEAKGELRKRIERNKLDVRITELRNERQDDGAPDFAESAPALLATWRNPAPGQKKQAVTTRTCPNCDTVLERVVHYPATRPWLNAA